MTSPMNPTADTPAPPSPEGEPADEPQARSAWLTFERAPVAMAHVGLDGSWLRVNLRLCDMLGYSRDELLAGLSFQDLTHPEDLDADLVQLRRTLAGEIDSYRMEKRYVHRSGAIVWGLLSVILLRDEAGEPEHFISVIQNITERRLLEHSNRLLVERLEERVAERTAELERSLADLEQFAHVASHDLKQPLRMVHSFAELLELELGDDLGEKAREYLGFLRDGTLHMRELLDALRRFSRVTASDSDTTEVDLGLVLDEVETDLQLPLRESGATLARHGELPSVRGRRPQLRQLFQNLVDNAVKYAGDAAPRIEVDCARDGDCWVLGVRDHGVGIDPGKTELALQLFKRLHHGDQIAGTGIGLAVAKRVVECHGGRLWIEPAVPGTWVRFTLPAAETEGAHER